MSPVFQSEKKMAIAFRTLASIVLTLAPLLATANPGKIGLIGDSMMVATNSNQMCGSGQEVLDCFESKLGGHDLAFSHGAGDFDWSIARRLGYGEGEILNAADDGEEWKDALAQAQMITSDPDVNAIFIQLGANDVCADYGHDYSGDLGAIASDIDATLSHLVEALPNGATIYWSGVIDVVGYRDTMVDRHHSPVFKTCQGLWNLDADKITQEAAQSLCKGADVPGDLCSDFADWAAIRDPVLDELVDFFVDAYNAERPCGRVLDGRTTEAERQEAREFNIALNALLEAKAREWSERQDRVRVVFTNRLFDLEIPPYFVSRLDCFHPNRAGQMQLAEEIWKGFHPYYPGNVAFFVDEFDDDDWCTQEFTSWDSCWYDYGDPGFYVLVDTEGRLRIAKRTSNRREHYVVRELGDLSDKTFAWMSFNHKRESLDNGDDRVTLEVYADGFWYELDVFKGSGNDVSSHPGEYYDLTPYLSSDMRIQFRPSPQKSMKDGEGVRLDNFNVFAWGPVPVPEPTPGSAGSSLLVLGMAALASWRLPRRRC
ncbi:MAG: hypothetical protein JRG86_14795 [Deltaproteobacteria bacterium]|jgi:lysophospholipase L1-like esterase|nr:hypothetical protein [Deltaproteobacteria bacterium]